MVVVADERTVIADQLGVIGAGSDLEPGEQGYNEALGVRIRAVRVQLGLSLQAVETLSRQEFKASVLGAYERGERSVSVARLQRLALVYKVPPGQLLPRLEQEVKSSSTGAMAGGGDGEDLLAADDREPDPVPADRLGAGRRKRRVERGGRVDGGGPEWKTPTPRGGEVGAGPRETASEGGGKPPVAAEEKVTVDLSGLEKLMGPEHEALRRYVEMLQVQRQDFNGRVLTIRSEDLRALGCIFGVVPGEMVDRLSALGILATD